ncbi:hypothetical protein M0R45_031584 [Rubus argutus]|uniref:F-box protein n=1 Tax=Rubus argutus TaxID=59490 RepID=A0AAW1WEJ0_RUBAR
MLKRLKSSPGEGEECRSSDSELFRTKIDDLHEVLLVEILCRLPSNKFLFQCKCVSKRWYSLISAPYLLGRYLCLQHELQNPILSTLVVFDSVSLVITSDHPVFKSLAKNFTLGFLPCYQQAKELEELAKGQGPWWRSLKPGSIVPPVVVGTYNDLVLCCATENDQRDYYLCNPYTKQWAALPPPPRVYIFVLVAFVCDPYYNYSNDDHDRKGGTFILNAEYTWKVVRVVPNSSDPNFHLEIFSSETRQWREIVVLRSPPFSRFVPALYGHTTYSFVAYNGMLYWWLTGGVIFELDLSTSRTRSNIAKSRFIELPEDLKGLGIGLLGVSGGRLRLCKTREFLREYHDEGLQVFRVRDLKQVLEDSQGKLTWLVNRVTIACQDIQVQYPNRNQVLAFHPNNEDIVYLSYCDTITTCNLRGGMLETATKSQICGGRTGVRYPFSLPWWPTPVPKTLEPLE